MPTTGGGGGNGGPSTGGGMPLTEDFGRWEFWWEFNKDRYLRLRETIRRPDVTTASDDFFMGAGRVPRDPVAPGEFEVRSLALPALTKTLEDTRNREVVMACLMAVAKIARDFGGEFDAIALIEPHLARDDRAVRATAALALGVTEDRRAVYKLLALLRDSQAGRRLVERESVDDWTRTFAAYGLGTLANGSADVATKRVAFDQLRAVLLDTEERSRDLRVGVLNAISAIDPAWHHPSGERLAEQALAALVDYYRQDLGAGEEALQAHAAQAIARLLAGRGASSSTDYYKDVFVRELTRRDARGRHIRRSAVLALGLLGAPVVDESSADFRISEALWNARKQTKDRDEARFVLIAAGQIGGPWNRTRLLEVLRSGRKALERPWAALALGVMTREALDEGRLDRPDHLVHDRLRGALTATKNPDAIASAAIALGLAGCDDAAPEMRALLEKLRNRELVAGCLCTALAMLGDDEAAPLIQDIVESSTKRPALLRRAAVALGMLRDKHAGVRLVELLREESSQSGIGALSSAVSMIGDRTLIAPLVDLLEDSSHGSFGRSMAAAALGGIADQRWLPWNEKFSANVNYLAAVPSFTSGGVGVFEIL